MKTVCFFLISVAGILFELFALSEVYMQYMRAGLLSWALAHIHTMHSLIAAEEG